MSALNFQKASQGSSLNFTKDLGLDFSKGLGGNIMINLNWGTNSATRSVDIDLALAVLAGGAPAQTTTEVKKAGFMSKLFGGKDETITKTVGGGRNVKGFVHCFDKTCSRGDGIIHHGDDTTGAWSDGEFIEIDPTQIGADVQELLPSILSYSGHQLKDLPFAHMKVYIGTKNSVVKPLFEVDLTNLSRGDMGAQFGKLVRSGDSWEWTTDIKKTTTAGSSGFRVLKELAAR